jgi:hypothetical protein
MKKKNTSHFEAQVYVAGNRDTERASFPKLLSQIKKE